MDFTRISAIDFSGDFEEAPRKNNCGTEPRTIFHQITWWRSYSQHYSGISTLGANGRIQGYRLIGARELCDTVNVEYSELGRIRKSQMRENYL